MIKKVSVMGGAGFVGSSLVRKLDAAGYQVNVITRNREHAKGLILLPNVVVNSWQPGEMEALTKLLADSDAVINLCGILHEDRHNTFESVHHQLPRQLAEICVACDIPRLLHMSALQASSDAPSQYLRSKAAGELALQAYRHKLDITIFRPSVIFGRGDQFINLFAKLIRLLPFILLAKPDAKFQPIWVEDVSDALVNSLQNRATFGNSYALGGPQVFSLKQLLQKVMAILNQPRPIIGLNDSLSYAQAFLMEWLPIKLMSRDNVRSMQVDSVTSAPIADELGLTLTPIDAVVAAYLVNQTPRGAYNQFRRAAGRAINVHRH